MTYLQSIILGLVQGLTEFLPVSSSGHLAILKNLFGGDFFESGITFDIMLHIGTLLAVFAVYYKDIWMLIKEFIYLVRDIFKRDLKIKTPYRRLLLMLMAGSVPAAVFGVLIDDFVDKIADQYLWMVGLFLFVTAALLYISDRVSEGNKTMKDLKLGDALFIGAFQAVAILPGISRSGSTITGGLLSGLKRSFAVKFSFLLSIPAILGAAILKLPKADGIPAGPAALGILVAAVSGFVAIKVLLKVIKKRKFTYFAYYCVALGVIDLVISSQHRLLWGCLLAFGVAAVIIFKFRKEIVKMFNRFYDEKNEIADEAEAEDIQAGDDDIDTL